jgi:hypothetical protein
VREQAKGQACGSEFGNAGVVAEQSWRMPGVGVAECAKPFVVAADKCWTTMHPSGGFHQAAVEFDAERNHGFGFIDIGARKEFGPANPKDSLGGRQEESVVLAPAGNIKQAKQYAFRANA